jgi:hypothetical protein
MTWPRPLLGIAFLLGLFALVACGEAPVQPPPAAPPASPFFSNLPLRIELKQRSMAEVPGTAASTALSIGDVTRGQVSVALSQGERILLEPTPLRQGQRVVVQLERQRYEIVVESLKNSLIGEDDATLMIREAVAETDESAVFADGELTPSDAPSSRDAAPAASQSSDATSEEARIEALIDHIASLDGAIFIRNGQEYAAADAANHLRMKWQWKKDEIASAEEFIVQLASSSSQSGDPYTMRLSDDRVVKVGEYLKQRLENVRTGSREPHE